MTNDRKELLLYVWNALYTERCHCGRCDCASSDPERLARRVLAHWARSYRSLHERELALAAIYRKAAAKYRKMRWPEAREDERRACSSAEGHERVGRTYENAARRFGRLARGLPAFAKEAA